MSDDLARRIWQWLPARTDSRRVTLPVTIGSALDMPVREVIFVLSSMERDGHAVRDQAYGPQTGWHRGKSFPEQAPQPEPVEPEPVEGWTLY